MEKLYLDCDGVILDTINRGYGELRDKGIEPSVKENYNMVQDYFENLDWNDFILRSGEIDNAIWKIKELQRDYDIEILTHVSSDIESLAKKRYFERVLPGVNVVIVPKKYKKTEYANPKGAILVDDYIPNLEEWESKGGIAIKFSDSGKPSKFITISDLMELRMSDIKKRFKVLE